MSETCGTAAENAQVEFDNDSVVGTTSGAASLVTSTKIHEAFDFESLDGLRDDVIQRLKDGEDFDAIIKSLAIEEVELLIADRLAAFIAIIRTASKPILFLDCLWMASGAAMREAATITQLAKKHGREKQAIQQAIARVKKEYFPDRRKARNERSDDAKAGMQNAYFPASQIYKAASK